MTIHNVETQADQVRVWCKSNNEDRILLGMDTPDYCPMCGGVL